MVIIPSRMQKGKVSSGHNGWAQAVREVGRMEEQRLRDEMKAYEREERDCEKEEKCEKEKDENEIKTILDKLVLKAQEEGKEIDTEQLVRAASEELKKQKERKWKVNNAINIAKDLESIKNTVKPSIETIKMAEKLAAEKQKNISIENWDDVFDNHIFIGCAERFDKKWRALFYRDSETSKIYIGDQLSEEILNITSVANQQEYIIITKSVVYVVPKVIKAREIKFYTGVPN